MRILPTIAVFCLTLQLPGFCEASEPEGAWGEPVNGIQIRLVVAAATQSQAATDYLPRLELQIRNKGTSALTFTLDEVSQGSSFEIDGRWYGVIGYAGNFASQGSVAPGAQSGNIRLVFCNTLDLCNGLYPMDANGAPGPPYERMSLLKPGRYSIRVRTRLSGAARRPRESQQTSNPIIATSNSVIIEIPDGPTLAQLLAQISAGGAGVATPVHIAVEKYPEAALDIIRTGMRAAENEFACAGLLSLVSKVDSAAATQFLLSKLSVDAGVPSQVAAAKILLGRKHPAAIPAMINAWRNIQPRLARNDIEQAHADCNNLVGDQRPFTGNQASAYNEIGSIISFLATSGDATAIRELGQGIENAPVDVRLAAVRVFLPRGNGGGSWGGRSVTLSSGADIENLPGGSAGAAIESLLVAALDDKARRYDMRGTWKGVSWQDPRICDFAALVLSARWPGKYQFNWSAIEAQDDAQLEVMRATWRAENRVTAGSSRQFAIDIPPAKWAAAAATEIVNATLLDTAYVGPTIHTGLLGDLGSLDRAARVVTDDDGKDRAAASKKTNDFAAAFRAAMNRATTIGNRNEETQEARDKSRDLAARLRAIYEQFLP